MTPATPDTEDLLRQADAGDGTARAELLARHRVRLRRMVACRLDRRLAARVGASDVVQEVLMEADRKLDRYLRERPLPFFPWLRRLAWEQLAVLYRRHVRAGRRSVLREEADVLALPDDSVAQLAARLAVSGSEPGEKLVRAELLARVQKALTGLSETDREVLVLRNLEQLSVAETAEVLAITPGAVKVRHLRALERLRARVDEAKGEDSR